MADDDIAQGIRDDIAQSMMAQNDPLTQRFGPQGWPGGTSGSTEGVNSGERIDPYGAPPSGYITDMRDVPYDQQTDVWPLPKDYGFDQTYTPSYFDDLQGLSKELGNQDIYNQTQQNIYDRGLENSMTGEKPYFDPSINADNWGRNTYIETSPYLNPVLPEGFLPDRNTPQGYTPDQVTPGGGTDVPWDQYNIPLTVPDLPPQQYKEIDPTNLGSYFDGSNPYADAGASGIPGSYGAPGGYGSNRRANL